MEHKAADAANEPPVASTAADRTEEFIRLFAASQRRIYGLVIAMIPNAADADDVFQNVSAGLWQKFHEFELGTDFTAWGLRFARFAALKHCEKRRRQGQLVFDDELLGSIADDAVQAVRDPDRRREALRACLQKLPKHARQLLEIRYESGLKTCREVAGRVGRSVEAVYKAIGRIHESLLRCIERVLSREDKA